jgi:hypothetical protein
MVECGNFSGNQIKNYYGRVSMDQRLHSLIKGETVSSGDAFLPRLYKLQIVYSDDRGATWKDSSCTAIDELIKTIEGLDMESGE